MWWNSNGTVWWNSATVKLEKCGGTVMVEWNSE